MPGNILQTILETKRKEVAALRSSVGVADLRAAAEAADTPRDLAAALTGPPRRLLNLIAEVKKASPSAGVIRAKFDPATVARGYQRGGADAISVLTDTEYFQGSLADLRAVRDAVDLPVLRKDFIIDPAQVYQSRAAGADAILLIAAALGASQLCELSSLTAELGMAALVEVHNADDLAKVLSAVDFSPAARRLLGINNRDLATFAVDIGTTVRLVESLGGDVPVVSESGIKTRSDVERLCAAGVKALLVGETLMRCGDAPVGIEALLGPPRQPR